MNEWPALLFDSLGGEFLNALAALPLPREFDLVARNLALKHQLDLVAVELHHLVERDLVAVDFSVRNGHLPPRRSHRPGELAAVRFEAEGGFAGLAAPAGNLGH